MQAVILAAGKATRTYPLTVNKAKCLLPILDSTILGTILQSVKGIVDEAIIIVGFRKDDVIRHFGDEYAGIRLTYVEQKEQLGTGHAMMCAEPHIKDRFMIMTGEDIVSPVDIKSLAAHRYACLAKEVDDPHRFGIFVTDQDNNIIDIEEKPKEPKTNLANTACWVMDKRIFDMMRSAGRSERDEYEATCALGNLIKAEKVHCQVVEDYWIPITYPWNLLEANVFFLRKIKESRIDGTVEDGVMMKGPVILGEGSVIKSGSCIEGPVFIGRGCTIGPHAYIRKDSIILDNVNTRAEIYDSLVMKGTTAKHHSYISHSVIGEGCNIACGTITADYRHDAAENWTLVKGEKVNSGRRKLGAFLGERVHTGIGTLIYPGRKIWPYCTTLPGEVVKEDIVESNVKTTDKR
ncbi:NTP transferase domain-containing protein [Candidatus Woesearchaeota archaeon]|nr:NTP transferase domain-containing protein [Candidatus Woesearchaeota archaeon]